MIFRIMTLSSLTFFCGVKLQKAVEGFLQRYFEQIKHKSNNQVLTKKSFSILQFPLQSSSGQFRALPKQFYKECVHGALLEACVLSVGR